MEAEKLSTPDPVDWIEKNFYIPETKMDPVYKGRIFLQPYQKDVIREILTPDENGNLKYTVIIWSDIKKSAKSTIAAAVNLYRATFTEWAEMYIIANDLKQADSRVHKYLKRAIALNPEMRSVWRSSGYTTTGSNGSVIEAIPIDPSGEAGSNADQLTWSELWGSNEIAKQRMWSEMTLSPTKKGQSFRWVESYAGFTEESDLLYMLYEKGVKEGKLLWPDKMYEVTGGEPTPLELYVNGDMLCLWNTQPRCPWQTPDYYKSEATVLTPNEFARMHRNQWVSSEETFVPIEWILACQRKEDEWPEYDKKRQPHILSLDAAVSDDTFGLYLGCRHPDKKDEVLTVHAQKWKPPKGGGKIDFIGTEENPGPELVLRRLVNEYNVIQVCYDPYQLADMAMRLKQEGLAWFKAFNQGTDRLIADSQLRDLIRDRRFWHRGEPDLIEHFQNADAKIDPEDHKIRIIKRSDRLKVDLAVAASMCCHELFRLNL